MIAAAQIFFGLLFFISPALELNTKDDVWTPEEFIAASGFDKALGAITKGVRGAANSPELAQSPAVEKLRSVWDEAVDATLSQEILQKGMTKRLSGTLDPSKTKKIKAFLGSDTIAHCSHPMVPFAPSD